MHPLRPWIVLAAFAAFAAQAAVIYKWTDANGVVHYSDQPVPGSREDHHRRRLPRTASVHRPERRARAQRPVSRQKNHRAGSQLHAVRHNLAGPRSNLLRRRHCQRAFGARTGSQAESDHHLASERQTTRRPGAGGDATHAAAIWTAAPMPSPRPSRINRRANRRAPTASLSSYASLPNCRRCIDSPSFAAPPTGHPDWPLNLI
jgi:hypothetical protein